MLLGRCTVILLLAQALHACASSRGSVSEAALERIDQLERENAELLDELATLRARFEAVMDMVGVQPTCVLPVVPSIDGVVLDVSSDLKLVVLDKGERDGVKTGYVFNIYKGKTFKGLARIQNVREATSTGMIFGEKVPIATGDSASTML